MTPGLRSNHHDGRTPACPSGRHFSTAQFWEPRVSRKASSPQYCQHKEPSLRKTYRIWYKDCILGSNCTKRTWAARLTGTYIHIHALAAPCALFIWSPTRQSCDISAVFSELNHLYKHGKEELQLLLYFPWNGRKYGASHLTIAIDYEFLFTSS